ncbi:hypothetical protein HOU00_gp228 [Caulobacter phage CcrPW]|uniref:Uncharacterized protein n=1 Tax=Caulobacter phage CcrPW TaxID=2283271 RepID=A0A385EDJ7_9CAUD|nr:hypothetical protein HOU00_gp228 [Caulobacter phage CcrPW]AXQ68897.1 hypothetical protein CcrPW_gp358 [Caulobacter phage CcrPW]
MSIKAMMGGIKEVQIVVRADGSSEVLGLGDNVQIGYEWNGQAYPTLREAERAKMIEGDKESLQKVLQTLLNEPSIDGTCPPLRLPQSYRLAESLLANPRLRELFSMALSKIAKRPPETYADLRGND